MKPFNLQEALAGKPVVSCNGAEVEKLVHFPNAIDPNERIVVLFKTGRVVFYREGGTNLRNLGSASVDLFMVSEKKEGWIGVYPPSIADPCCPYPRASALIYPTEQEVRNRAFGTPLAIVKITWEE